MPDSPLYAALILLGGLAYLLEYAKAHRGRVPMGVRVRFGWADLDDPRSAEEIRAAYARGRIGEAELGRRLDVALDEDRRSLRNTVEGVSGIGSDTSWNIAERVRSERGLRQASLDELEEIPNVGEKRARLLKERVQR